MKKEIILSLPDLDLAKGKATNGDFKKTIKLEINQSLKEYANNRFFFVKTYGCQANVRDSETFKGMLLEAGFQETRFYSKASVIIFNTCSVREKAEEKVFGEIGKLKNLGDKNEKPIIIISGCMVERPQIVEAIRARCPYVNIVLGTHEVSSLLDLITMIIEKKCKRVISVSSKGGEVIEGLPSCREHDYKAFVNIMYGCNKFCSYCIVPYTRGRERSRLLSDIIEEVNNLKELGYQEVMLLGQNVNAYGKDLLVNVSFATLLEEVAKTGINRVRFMTSHPWDFSKEALEVIAKYPNIMKSIHLPVQSGSDKILKLMARRYDQKQYLDLVKDIKTIIPNVSLTTDIIVGFPGETEEDFLETLKVVEEVRYDSVFTFIYSPRAGTPSTKMIDNVSKEEKHNRFNRLVKVVDSISTEIAKCMVGKTYKVLVDKISNTNELMLSGYTESSKLVHFKGDKNLIGKIVDVKILESHTYSLIGELVNE